MRLKTLGGLGLEGSHFRRVKHLLLLSYLAVEGSKVRYELAELFWVRARDAKDSLSKALSQLRHEVPGSFREAGEKLWTELPSDAQELLRAAEAGELEQVLSCYDGPFLAGVELPALGVELEEWVYGTRERLANRVRQAHLCLGEHAAVQAQFELAAKHAEDAYLLRGAPEPDQEEFRRLYTLLKAGISPRAAEVRKEAESFGFPLSLEPEEAQAQLLGAQADFGIIPPNPYRGLAFFQEEDAPFFFGRNDVVDELCRAVHCQPCTVLVGSSGSGKSSLVFAGLVPRLRTEHRWLITHLRPGRDPFLALGLALLTLLEPSLSKTDHLAKSKELAERLRAGDLTLADVTQQLRQEHPGERVLLIIDQVEELYTLAAPAETREVEAKRSVSNLLLDELLHAAAQGAGYFRLVLSIRADFIAAALEYPPLVDVLQKGQFFLGPMDDSDLRAVIEEPAYRQRVTLEEGLRERILHDLSGQEGSLPLLEFALTQLWDRQQRGQLTHRAYDAIGGVEQALANHADRTLADLSREEQATTPSLFLQLVCPGVGQEDTRRAATIDEIGEENWPLVSKLATARLIVTGRDSSGMQTAEVIHEALIRRWRTLQRWINEHRAFRIWQEHLRDDMRLWQVSNKDGSTLLHGFRLDEAKSYSSGYADQLSPGEHAFIQASLDLKKHEEDEVRRRQEERERSRLERARLQGLNYRRLRLFFGVALILVALAAWQWRAAETQRRLALARQLGAQALAAAQLPGPANGYADRAALLARQAVQLVDSPESYNNLLRTLQNHAPSAIPLQGHNRAVLSVAFSPDGELLASSGEDNTVILWDVVSRIPSGEPLQGHLLPVVDVAFSPDGHTLASGSADGIILWDVEQRRPLGEPLWSRSSAVTSVAFSPDGRLLASGGEEGAVILWDVSGRAPLGEALRGHRLFVTSLSFSPDGKVLASSSRDGTVILWDVNAHMILGQPLQAHTSAVQSIAFSPDGKTLASGSEDQTVRLWDVARQTPIGEPLQAHSDGVWDVAFSPDGKLLATSSGDQTIRLWDAARQTPSGKPLQGPKGEAAAILSVAFSPDGKTLAGGIGDSTVILWDLSEQVALGESLQAQRLPVPSVAFSPDGETMASSSMDGTIIMWDAQRRLTLGEPLRGHQSTVWSVAFNPEGTLLASGSDDRTIMLWNVETRLPVGEPLEGHRGGVRSVAFSPDGNILASGGSDRTIRFWDVERRTPIGKPLDGHREAVTKVAFSPDGKTLASAGEDGAILLWDVGSQASLGELPGHHDLVSSIAFSPDGTLLASGGLDRTIHLWQLDSRQPWGKPLHGHHKNITSLAFSPDGRLLASASDDAMIILWDVKSGTAIGEPFRSHRGPVLSLAFSPDGRSLVSSGDDGTIVLWDTDPASWLARACQLANRNLTKAEWQRYLGNEPYQKTCPAFPEGS